MIMKNHNLSEADVRELPKVEGAGVPRELHTTAIPIREQFRIRRFWFFYHDLRAFTTSVSMIISG